MNNTETIIKELEDAITEATYPDRPRKFMMSLELAEKVLVLLKAQQPMVMTLEEIKGKVSGGETAFLVDYNDGGGVVWVLICRYLTTLDEFVVIDGIGNTHNYGADCYGVDWRCWTSKPTDEQRQSEKWN